MNKIKKNLFGYVAIALVVTMVSIAAYAAPWAKAEMGAVRISENTTVVTSPFTAAVQKVHGSVVGVNNYTVTSSSQNPFYGFGFGYGYRGSPYDEDDATEALQGTGSGVVVAQGYVLTNYHVVEDATRLEVTSDEKVYQARLMGSDEGLDLAVLYVEDLDLPPVVLGDSDKLNIGDWAICIGNPLGFSGTTTVGVISALNREITGSTTDAYGKRTTNTMIQTDAAINSGNSGGGLFNVAGELIGIPSLKYSSNGSSGRASIEGIGMAIPINVAKPLINAVIEGRGNVPGTPSNDSITSGVKPRLGVTIVDMNTNHYALINGLLPKGAYVAEVEAGSPAEKAGIEVGDIIVEIDGTIISKATDMTSLLQTRRAGDRVTVKVYRVEGGLENVKGNNIPDGEYIVLEAELKILDDVVQ